MNTHSDNILAMVVTIDNRAFISSGAGGQPGVVRVDTGSEQNLQNEFSAMIADDPELQSGHHVFGDVTSPIPHIGAAIVGDAVWFGRGYRPLSAADSDTTAPRIRLISDPSTLSAITQSEETGDLNAAQIMALPLADASITIMSKSGTADAHLADASESFGDFN